MLASSTHDTKRSEDVRARINVLSEIPAEWYRAIRTWQRLNEEKKIQVAGENVPSANEEYFLYQTLLGAWPLTAMDGAARADFVVRIYLHGESPRRQKVNTSWSAQIPSTKVRFTVFWMPF
jgi:(1->4)-alpha-D-glucan 1-alpha-D-glucosylmutase